MDAGGSDTGQIFVYAQMAGVWALEATLAASTAPNSRLGESLDLEGDRLVAGAPALGKVFVFTRENGNWSAPVEVRPNADQPGLVFGASVDLVNGPGGEWDLLVGALAGGVLPGRVFLFSDDGTQWRERLVGVPTAIGLLGLMILELLVALIQAYIFTLLSSLFIGLGAGGAH